MHPVVIVYFFCHIQHFVPPPKCLTSITLTQMLLIGTTAITWSSQTVAKPGVPGPPALDTLVVSLNGTGVLSADYLYSGGWHHVVVQKSGTTGEQVFPKTKTETSKIAATPRHH